VRAVKWTQGGNLLFGAVFPLNIFFNFLSFQSSLKTLESKLRGRKGNGRRGKNYGKSKGESKIVAYLTHQPTIKFTGFLSINFLPLLAPPYSITHQEPI